MDRNLRWFAMPVGMQLANIGSEVHRALRFQSKNDLQKMHNFYDKSIDLLNLTKQDPKNQHRLNELNFCQEELEDYFIGKNQYHSTPASITAYYDSFI